MKYLLFLSWFELGGAERQALNLAEYLVSAGQDVTVLGLYEPGQVNRICEEKGIRCEAIKPRNDLASVYHKALHRLHIRPMTNEEIALSGMIRNLKRFIVREEFDVCISYCATANTMLGLISPEVKAACIWYQRDAGVYDKTEGLQPVAAKRIPVILANSISGADWIRKAYGRDARIVYNGVVAKASVTSRDEWRRKVEADADSIVCTMVAQLTHDSKDHMFLLKVWEKLVEQGFDHKLVFAGRFASSYEDLKAYVAAHGLEPYVFFLGHIDDVFGLLRATDICVFASKTEGSPNGILEGCLCGLPVVANNTPEIHEIVSDENHPYLFDSGDIDHVYESICRLGSDAGLREHIGSLNRAKTEEVFDPARNFEEVIRIAREEKEKIDRENNKR